MATELPPDLTLRFLVQVDQPVALRSAFDGTPRLFIVEKTGRIRIYDTRRHLLLPTPFLDLSAEVDLTNHEQGLLGLVFHPEYERNGFFYVYFVFDPAPDPDPRPDRTILRRYRVSQTDPNLADPSSGISILEIEQPSPIHKGGDLFFGPDQYLYLATGDGGPAFDPQNNAQNPTNLLGKMLRLALVDEDDGEDRARRRAPQGVEACGQAKNYEIPPDNPFVGDREVCDEIYFFGLRNPWRWSFDRQTFDFWLGDVGQTQVEEIDRLTPEEAPGANLGWSCQEGDLPVPYNPCRPGTLHPPLFTHGHTDGFCAVIGGYRYRGSMPSLQGVYFYGDWCTGRIYAASETDGSWTTQLWLDTELNLTGFGEDQQGELYVLEDGGNVYALTASEQALWVDSFESGTTAGWSASFP